MGSLFYGSMAEPFRIPDIVLAHLQVVTTARLRRGEGFILSWRQADAVAGRRCTLWMHAAIPLRFVTDADARLPIDTGMLRRFAEAAHSSAGLVIDLAEPHAAERAASSVAAR